MTERNKLFSAVIWLLFVPAAFGQLHERHAAVVNESSAPTSIRGGVTFEAQSAYATTYEDALNYLKRQDYSIDSASKDTGQIITAMTVKGHWHQTGTRVVVTLIQDSSSSTTVRVAVTEQKRYKALQTEPWGDAKVNEKRSSEFANHLRSALSGS